MLHAWIGRPVVADAVGHDRRPAHATWVIIAALLLFAALAYGPQLGLPFIGDDYVFLDRVLGARFADLWSLRNTDFGWYRPLSREFHFWWFGEVLGLGASGFRIVAVVMWIATLALYAWVIRTVTGSRGTTAIATLGVAGLALWGTPLLWISGSQDLWMLLFAMLSLGCFVAGRSGWAAAALVPALLSKETAAVLPAVFLAHATVASQDSPRRALRRVAPCLAVALAWLAVHPVLLGRAAHALERPEGNAPGLSVTGVVLRSLLANVNLDLVPRPESVTRVGVGLVVAAATTLAAAVGWLVPPGDHETPHDKRGPIVRFAMVWAALGWAPLVLPTVGWQAYYGGLGAMGFWLAAGVLLAGHRRLAVGAVLGLAMVGGLRSTTPSWEWGNTWFQRRAGNILNGIRLELMRQHPRLPAHSRLYFGHIPNNIGLIAGQSPAVRVWYRDPTLSAGFYSWYRMRRLAEPPGRDFFFRFDSVRALVEIRTGPEDVPRAMEDNPEWASDHERLAMLFEGARDFASAGEEFEKLSRLPDRAEDAIVAGVCRERAGDLVRPDSLYRAAAARLRVPLAEVAAAAAQLRASVPVSSRGP